MVDNIDTSKKVKMQKFLQSRFQ